MKAKRALLALAISAAVLGTAGYAIGQNRADTDTKKETADEFVARVIGVAFEPCARRTQAEGVSPRVHVGHQPVAADAGQPVG